MKNISLDMWGTVDLKPLYGEELTQARALIREQGKPFSAMNLNVIDTRRGEANGEITRDTVVKNPFGEIAKVTHTLPYHHWSNGGIGQVWPSNGLSSRFERLRLTKGMNIKTWPAAFFSMAKDGLTARAVAKNVQAVVGSEETIVAIPRGLLKRKEIFKIKTDKFKFLHAPQK